jgi:hypothetical protein
VRLDEDAARLQRFRHAHQRHSSAEAVAERRHPSLRLLPDLAGEVVAVVRDRIWIVELIGRVVARLSRELGRPFDHVVDVLRRHPGPALHRRDDVEVGAEGAHELAAFLGETVGDHDQAAVAPGTADERERGPSTTSRVLDDGVARREHAFPLGSLDHRKRHPVLERAGRIAVLELQPQLRAVCGRAARQTHERRVADGVEDRGQRRRSSHRRKRASARRPPSNACESRSSAASPTDNDAGVPEGS